MRTLLFVGSAVSLTAAFLALAAFVVLSESLALLATLAVVFVAILFCQTRHLFALSRAAAIGVLTCYFLATAGALYGTERMIGQMPWTSFLTKSTDDQNKIFVTWQAGKGASKAVASANATAANGSSTAAAIPATASATPVNIPPAPAPIPAPLQVKGGPDLQALYAQLQKARATLDPNDPEAVARFNQQAAAYNQEKAMAAAISAREATTAGRKEEQEEVKTPR